MSQLDDLYRRVIMDHYKTPRNRGELDNGSVTVNLNNPTCGDRISLAASAGGRHRPQRRNSRAKAARSACLRPR